MIRYVCDVEGCETTTDSVESANMLGPVGAPPGWHRIETARELDKTELRRLPAPARMAARRNLLLGSRSHLVCPNHPMPAFKEGSGSDDGEIFEAMGTELDGGLGGV